MDQGIKHGMGVWCSGRKRKGFKDKEGWLEHVRNFLNLGTDDAKFLPQISGDLSQAHQCRRSRCLMKYFVSPSHVAVLVPSVRRAAEYLQQFGLEIGEEESFAETKEIYVQGKERNSLLLMEARESGSYRRAFEKRGPGIHHLAVDVLDLGAFLHSLSGSGWLLHLNSLKTIKDYRTAYLARPGFPALIEVQEKKSLASGPLFVETVGLRIDAGQKSLVHSVGLEGVVKPSAEEPFVGIQGRKLKLEALF